MQMLRWRKRQNEAKIRSKLLQTKQMKEQDQLAQLVTNKAQIKAEWIQRVVEDEINKPLQVTDEFIEEMVELERQNRARQQKARELYASTIAKEKARIQKTVDLRTRTISWHSKNEAWKKESRFITKAGTEALLTGGFEEGELDSLEVLTKSLRRRRRKKGEGAKGESVNGGGDEPATKVEESKMLSGSASMPALSDPRLDALLDIEKKIKIYRAQVGQGWGAAADERGAPANTTLSKSTSASLASTLRGDAEGVGFKKSIAIASKDHPNFAQSLQELSTSSSLFSTSSKPGQKHPMEKLKSRNKTISVRF